MSDVFLRRGNRAGRRHWLADLAVIFVGGVAHHLMQSGGVQIAQQPVDDVRVMQAGIAGEVINLGRRLNRDVGGVNGCRAHVGDRRHIRQLSGADAFEQLLVALVQQRPHRPYFQIRLPDEPVHHLPLVELRGAEGAARGRGQFDQLVERAPRRAAPMATGPCSLAT